SDNRLRPFSHPPPLRSFPRVRWLFPYPERRICRPFHHPFSSPHIRCANKLCQCHAHVGVFSPPSVERGRFQHPPVSRIPEHTRPVQLLFAVHRDRGVDAPSGG